MLWVVAMVLLGVSCWLSSLLFWSLHVASLLDFSSILLSTRQNHKSDDFRLNKLHDLRNHSCLEHKRCWMSCTPKFNTLGLFKSIIINMSNHFNDVCLWQKPAALIKQKCAFIVFFNVFTPVLSFASSGLSMPGEESSNRWSTSPTAQASAL